MVRRNLIEQWREEAMYVDYVQTESGYDWYCPNKYLQDFEPIALKLSKAMRTMGFTNSGALEVIAQFWQPIEFTNDFHGRDLWALNERTLQALDQCGLLHQGQDISQDTYLIIQCWQFPLYSVDLKPRQVKLEELQLQAEQLSQDDFLREFNEYYGF